MAMRVMDFLFFFYYPKYIESIDASNASTKTLSSQLRCMLLFFLDCYFCIFRQVYNTTTGDVNVKGQIADTIQSIPYSPYSKNHINVFSGVTAIFLQNYQLKKDYYFTGLLVCYPLVTTFVCKMTTIHKVLMVQLCQ